MPKEKRKEKIEDLKDIEREGSRLFFHFYDFESSKLRQKLRKNPKESIFLFLVGFVISSLITTFIFAFTLSSIHIKFALPEFSGFLPHQAASVSFSDSNNNTVDPYEVLLSLKNHTNNIVLVDVRSKEEYQKGHITTALSLPSYNSSDNLTLTDSEKDNIQQLSGSIFAQNKQVVLYGQTSYSKTPYEVAKILGHKDKVGILGIGYNEWAHMKTLWVPESEWDKIDPQDYVQH